MNISFPNHPRHHHCHVDPVEKTVDLKSLAQAETAFLLVWGMGCPACAMRVRNSLLRVDGVLTVDIALERGLARVRYDPAQVVADALPAAVAAADSDGHHDYSAQLLI